MTSPQVTIGGEIRKAILREVAKWLREDAHHSIIITDHEGDRVLDEAADLIADDDLRTRADVERARETN